MPHRPIFPVVLSLILALTTLPAAALAQVPLSEARIEAEIAHTGNAMAVGFGALWIVGANAFARIDTTSNTASVISVHHAENWFNAGAVGEGAVWLPSSRFIYKINPDTRQPMLEIAVDMRNATLGVGAGSVWAITGGENNELRRFSATTGVSEATIALPGASTGAVFAHGSLWLTGIRSDELYRVDPTTNTVAITAELDSRPGPIVAGEGALWVYNEGTGLVQRIDPASGKVVAGIATGEVGKGSIDVGGGYVWLHTRLTPLIRIDPSINAMNGKFFADIQAEYAAIRYAAGSLWISGGKVHRIAPPN